MMVAARAADWILGKPQLALWLALNLTNKKDNKALSEASNC